MREIKFRGKLLNNKHGWSYGNLSIKKNAVMITPDETIVGVYGQVDKETVGQYTGLKDKNGTRIYEGDIIEAVYRIETFNNEIILDLTGRVRYFETCYYLINEEDSVMLSDLENIEIIGNVYDNPELLEEQE